MSLVEKQCGSVGSQTCHLTERSLKQYLAVLVLLEDFPRDPTCSEKNRSCIQIWSFQAEDVPDADPEENEGEEEEEEEDPDEMQVDPEDEDEDDEKENRIGNGTAALSEVDELDESGSRPASPDADEPVRKGMKDKGPRPVPFGGLEHGKGICEAVVMVGDATWTDFKWMPLGCCDDVSLLRVLVVGGTPTFDALFMTIALPRWFEQDRNHLRYMLRWWYQILRRHRWITRCSGAGTPPIL